MAAGKNYTRILICKYLLDSCRVFLIQFTGWLTHGDTITQEYIKLLLLVCEVSHDHLRDPARKTKGFNARWILLSFYPISFTISWAGLTFQIQRFICQFQEKQGWKATFFCIFNSHFSWDVSRGIAAAPDMQCLFLEAVYLITPHCFNTIFINWIDFHWLNIRNLAFKIQSCFESHEEHHIKQYKNLADPEFLGLLTVCQIDQHGDKCAWWFW